jgi:SAM-dependent methyltransferase
MDPVAFVLSTLPPPPARVLEVGCGAGELALAIDAAGYDVVAVDPRAPAGPIFRQTTLAELDDPGPFEVAVARYSLHHIEDLDGAVDRIASLLRPGGKLVVEEFGWDRVDDPTVAWLAEQQSVSVDEARAAWDDEHAGLHRYDDLRRALERGFDERSFTWQPFLHRPLERPDLEPRERAAIERGEIQALGFRWIGVRRAAQ